MSTIAHNGNTSEDNYNKDETIAGLKNRIRSLEQRESTLGLNYRHIPEAGDDAARISNGDIPVLNHVPELSLSKSTGTDHLLIEGDNLPALSTLMSSYYNRVNVIYIDPPYNTGNTDWVYNNKFVAGDDPFHHSKWLSFMESRLRLAHDLLADDGFIACMIDHYELFYLGTLMDKVFGEQNRVGVIDILINPSGRNQARFFSPTDEYMLVYAKDAYHAHLNNISISDDVSRKFTENDNAGRYYWKTFTRIHPSGMKSKKPSFYYPIYAHSNGTLSLHKESQNDVEVYPECNSHNEPFTWVRNKSGFMKAYHDNPSSFRMTYEHKHPIIQRKFREFEVIKTTWNDGKYNPRWNGTALIDAIIGPGKFDFPKSLYAVKDIIKILSHSKDDIILDFFAGSGTTGHAVAELNGEDGGHRRAILVTNNFETRNDGSRRETGIARGVTAPRMKNVLTGKWADGKHHDALPGNLVYYRLNYVDTAPMIANNDVDNDNSVFNGVIALREDTHRILSPDDPMPVEDIVDDIVEGTVDKNVSAVENTTVNSDDSTTGSTVHNDLIVIRTGDTVRTLCPTLADNMSSGAVTLLTNEDATQLTLIVHDENMTITDPDTLDAIASELAAVDKRLMVYMASDAPAGEYMRTGSFDDINPGSHAVDEKPFPVPYVEQEKRVVRNLRRGGFLADTASNNDDIDGTDGRGDSDDKLDDVDNDGTIDYNENNDEDANVNMEED